MNPRQRLRPLSSSDVEAALEEARYPLNLTELADKLKAPSTGRAAIKKHLQQLVRRGAVAEVRSGRYMLASRKRTQEKDQKGTPGTKDRKRRVGKSSAASSGLPKPSRQSSHSKNAKPSREAKDIVRGRLTMHRDGYGFVIPDEPVEGLEGDVFIPPNASGDAMHGDRVRAQIRRRGKSRGRAEGTIVEVEKRAHPTIVGLLRLGSKESLVEPYERRLQQEIVIPHGKENPPKQKLSRKALEGAVVNVEITRYPKGSGRPEGCVLEVLGHPGEFGVDVEMVIRKYHLPFQFEKDVESEARKIPAQPHSEDVAQRRDFRHLPIVTIDGEDSKDFDDAVRVARMENGHYMLHVHIADVAHYVRPGAALDREARLRGTSVYFPDRAVPMLPEKLSNGVCSLRPDEERLVMSCLMEISAQGEVVRYWLGEGVIRSAARMTYTAVNKILEGDPKALEKHRALVSEFERMRELALLLNEKRERRGSIDFDLPDPVIRFDEHGRMTGITRSERNIANRIIEEFMLAANETVARFLHEQKIASLSRAHDTPEAKKVLEFEEIAATFGYSFGLRDKSVKKFQVTRRRAGQGRRQPREVERPAKVKITPFHYQQLTEKIAGKPEERILSFLMLRSLKKAVYTEEQQGHFALAAPFYTHFTSPIRRYPDLIIHRLLKWTLKELGALQAGALFYEGTFTETPAAEKGKNEKGKKKMRGPLKIDEVRTIATESSEAERRAEEAERELVDIKKLEYMQQHLGDEFEGLIINAARFGFWVELYDMFVEGIVPVETLDPRADYIFREATRSIVPGRKSRVKDSPVYRIGGRVKVRVDRIDMMARKVEFSVLSLSQDPH